MSGERRAGRKLPPVSERPHGAIRRRQSKYDYASAKMLYVEGTVDDKGERDYPTLAKISELLDIPPNRLRERSAADRWTDAKAAFIANMEKVRQEKRIQNQAKAATEVDEKALGVSKLGANLVQARMAEMAQELGKRNTAKKKYDELVATAKAEGRTPRADEIEATEFDPWAPHPVDARELQMLAATAAAWYALSMKALGETETQRLEVTGAAGAPVSVRADVRGELVRDDPSRLQGLLIAISRAQVAVVDQGAGGRADDPEVLALLGGSKPEPARRA